ncbi:hypothetical protein OAJ27_02075, partial [bacterium]|nr:hypothetical protein [bacterium]
MNLLNYFKLVSWLSLRDYRSIIGKTLLTFLGLVLSIALTTSINSYIDTIESNLTQQNQTLTDPYPESYLAHNSGEFTPKNIQRILSNTSINYIYPFNSTYTEIVINNNTVKARVIGIDFIYLANYLQNNLFKNKETESFDLTQDYIVLAPQSTKIDNFKFQTIFLQQKPQILQLPSIAEYIVIMDIALYQTYFNEKDTIQKLYLDPSMLSAKDLTYLTTEKTINIINSAKQNSNLLSQAFFLNLKLISILANIISGLLVYQFFHFLFQRRKSMLHLLFELGMTKKTSGALLLLEGVIFGISALGLGLLTGYGLAMLGLNILSTTLNTLYYSISIQELTLHISTILKASSILALTLFLSLNSFILERITAILKYKKGLLCAIAIIALSSLTIALRYMFPHFNLSYILVINLILSIFFTIVLCLNTIIWSI